MSGTIIVMLQHVRAVPKPAPLIKLERAVVVQRSVGEDPTRIHSEQLLHRLLACSPALSIWHQPDTDLAILGDVAGAEPVLTIFNKIPTEVWFGPNKVQMLFQARMSLVTY